ncbi:MAG: hypothetical protein F6K24_36145 [Okeania sp. SIO2D1]|nr:hypothetical protein [Okeania sp. SIO2D1]
MSNGKFFGSALSFGKFFGSALSLFLLPEYRQLLFLNKNAMFDYHLTTPYLPISKDGVGRGYLKDIFPENKLALYLA